MSAHYISRIRGRVWPPALQDYFRWHRQTFGKAPSLWRLFWLRLAQVYYEHPRAIVGTPAVATPIELRIGTSDGFVFDQVFVDREYEIDYPSPQRIVDAGANVGLATLWFANRHPNAEIIAIEPDAGNFVQLQRNVRGYPNVRCIQAGLWHRSGRLRVQDSQIHAWAYRFEESSDSAGIATRTVDDLGGQLPSGSIDLLKLDIEGAEREVLLAGGDWVDQVTTVIVECHDRDVPGCSAAVDATFPESSFERRICGENIVLVRRTPNGARSL